MSGWPPAPREPALQPASEPAALPPPQPRRVRLPLHKPVVTYVLLGLISLVFVGQLGSQQLLGQDLFLLYGAKINALIALGQYWRLVTPIFLHGSLLHFFFNMYALYNLGREAEAFMGPARFTLLFFYAGVAGTVLSLLLTPNPSVGASGAIFGLIGAQGVFFYRHRQLFGENARRGLQQIVFIALINLAIGLQGNIDNWGHLGGLIGGVALAFVLGPAWRLEPTAALPVPQPPAFPETPGIPAVPAALTLVDRQPPAATRGLLLAGLLVALALVTAFAILAAR